MSDERELNMRKNSVNKTINTSLSTVAQKIGLDSLTMHMARHSFAVQAINNGMDLKVLSKLLGHQITDTTERYYAKILDATRNKEYAAKTDFYELTPDLGFLNKR